MNNTAKRAEQQHWPIYVVESQKGSRWELRASELSHAEAHLLVFYPHDRIVGLRTANGSTVPVSEVR